MSNEICQIVGGGHAGVQLAISLRKEGWEGPINIISTEDSLPYQKPPLSKAFLAGEKEAGEFLLQKEEMFKKKNIDVTLGKAVTKIDREQQTITLDDGEVLPYGKLALCTGATPKKLKFVSDELKNVFYLNDLQEARNIRNIASDSKKAVVIGGGYLGLEIAATFCKLGIDVVVLEAEDRVLKRVAADETSRYFYELHKERGVDVRVNSHAVSLEGEKVVEGVVDNQGNSIPCDIVVIGIGVAPNIGLAESISLEIKDGILVDKFCRTSDSNIMAVGDCAYYPNVFTGCHIRLESVQSAVAQAKSCASYLCGKSNAVEEVPWFWSDQFDTKLQIAGVNRGYTDTVIRGDMKGNKFSLWYFNDEKLLAVDCVNSAGDFMPAKKAIAKNISIQKDMLRQAEIALSDIFTASS